MIPMFILVSVGLEVLDILPLAFKLSVVLRLKCSPKIKLDMVSRLIFEPIVCYSRYWIFCWTNPCRKTSNINMGSPEIQTHIGDKGDT